ncbi:hypothetical protein Cni_G04209 [Canna indica]|uniref:Uncharacterized protein n=1 Tax=Canna indica TaxID=4628 RepID=A0AAQ3JT48_9LILI|nr:hypothetical protein Cni_G04209 [Canna indica]
MSGSTSEAIALFRSQLQSRRFDDRTLGTLESVLVTRNVQSLIETRAALRELLRSEASSVMGGVSVMTVDEKLRIVQFFVGAFALVGDIESCLALKYEALILRESKYLQFDGLQVTYEEWLTFANDSIDNGFFPIAIQGIEKALQCIQINKLKGPEFAMSSVEEHIVDYIKNLKNITISLIEKNSVRVQSSEYMKRKDIQKQASISRSRKANQIASSVFRSAIEKRNMQKLQRSQGLQENW